MLNSDPLVPFGIGLIIVVGLFIVVPFFRGKSDLVTAWNTLLVGIIIFTGLAAIEVKYEPNMHYEQLSWFQPTAGEVQWLMRASAAFVVAILAAYYLNTWAKSFAQKRLRKWPEVTPPVTFFILGWCVVVLAISVVLRRVSFIGPISLNLAQVAAPAACVFSFMLWYRNRLNLAWLFLFFGVFACAALYAMVVSGGRRLLLSVCLGPVMCVYWMQLRYWGRAKIILAMGLAAVLVLGVSIVYSKFRYYSNVTGEQRTTSGIIAQMHGLRGQGNLFAVFMRGPLEYFAQSTAHYSLLAERYVAQGALNPVPLNTLRFLITYPIPRKLWPQKPQVAGLIMPRDAAHLPTNNWGLGVAGHGAYEGGIPAVILYAILLAFGARFLDEPLRLQPGNPFLIYMHAAAYPHIIAIPRGDMGTMTVNAIHCVLFAVLLGIACRAIFGTSRIPLTTAANSRRPETLSRWERAG